LQHDPYLSGSAAGYPRPAPVLSQPTCERETDMAQIAKPEAEKVSETAKDTTDRAAEQGRRAAGQAAEVTREARLATGPRTWRATASTSCSGRPTPWARCSAR
jgi:hypothetical protein